MKGSADVAMIVLSPRQKLAVAQNATRAAILALSMLCAHCRREPAPQPASSQSTSASMVPRATGSLSPPAEAPSASRETRAPAPALPAAKKLAWQFEQYGRAVEAKAHTVELVRAPFTLVFHLRAGIRDVLVNASFKPQTYDAARLGWPFLALAGIQGASRVDQPPDENNRLRDIHVNDDAPNQWLVCQPNAACSGFDDPCESTVEGVVCRHTVERAQVFSRNGDTIAIDSRVEIASLAEKNLYLVFLVPGHWSEDERAGKMPYRTPELARDWAMIVWKLPP